MLEKTIESYLRKHIKALGGTCLKWKSPQYNGVPDRIIMVYRQIWFVELKRPLGNTRRLQVIVGEIIREHTDNYCVLSTIDEVDNFIKKVKEINNETVNS
jgi:hypothetical protein